MSGCEVCRGLSVVRILIPLVRQASRVGRLPDAMLSAFILGVEE